MNFIFNPKARIYLLLFLAFFLSFGFTNAIPTTENITTYAAFANKDLGACNLNGESDGDGIKLIARYNQTLLNVTTHLNMTGHVMRIHNSGNFVVAASNMTARNSSGQPYFETFYNMTAGSTYYLHFGNYSGANTQRAYTNAELATPKETIYWTISKGWNGDDNGGCDSGAEQNFIFNVFTIKAQNTSDLYGVCYENWTYTNLCDGLIHNFTIDYDDENACNTTTSLPADNGTIQDCCVEDWTQDLNPCEANVHLISYTDTNSCGTTAALHADNGTYELCEMATQPISIDNELWIHILFLALIYITFSWAYNQSSFLKFGFAITGILVFFYARFIDFAIFGTTENGALLYVKPVIIPLLYFIAIFLVLSGVYYVFYKKD